MTVERELRRPDLSAVLEATTAAKEWVTMNLHPECKNELPNLPISFKEDFEASKREFKIRDILQ